GARRVEVGREALEGRAGRTVEAEPVHELAGDDPVPRHEAGVAHERVADPVEAVVEPPVLAGTVELELPDRRVDLAISVPGPRAAELRLREVHPAEDVADVRREDAVVVVAPL